jgi:hypothetical protein
MQMIKNLHASNKTLEEEIENHKKAGTEKVLVSTRLIAGTWP